MTDDRNNPPGPPPEPAAPPPPLAEPPPMAAPPPQAPPVAQAPVQAPPPAAPAAPGAAKGSPLPWVIAGILGLSLVIFVVLYFTGVLDRDSGTKATGAGSGFGSPSNTLSGTTGSSGAGTVAPPAGLSMATLAGTWGPRCPASRAESITFLGNGRFVSQGGEANYSISGNTLTLYGTSQTIAFRWEFLSENSARVTQVSDGAVDTVYRCDGTL